MTTSTCAVCESYLERRAAVLGEAFALRAFIRGVDFFVVAREYMHCVHQRHLAGGTLSTRTHTTAVTQDDGSTRVTVSRWCNGCDESIGDATAAELAAAVAGQPLPDVRLECGCYGSARDRSAA